MSIESAMLLIDMQPRSSARIHGGHFFTCPECYEHKPCDGDCDVEYDMRLDDGRERCCYSVCDECRALKDARAQLRTGGHQDAREAGW